MRLGLKSLLAGASFSVSAGAAFAEGDMPNIEPFQVGCLLTESVTRLSGASDFTFSADKLSQYNNLIGHYDTYTVDTHEDEIVATEKGLDSIATEVSDAFKTHLDGVSNGKPIVVVYYSSSWLSEDPQTQAVLALADRFPIVKVDTDQFPMLYQANVIDGMDVQVVQNYKIVAEYYPDDFLKTCFGDPDQIASQPLEAVQDVVYSPD
ncbi:MAG: hypothetical protein GW778_02585 [Alphaproteobacteria bacterium]|nr:hypothetical protein [Alphaproteobacteria bacterium]